MNSTDPADLSKLAISQVWYTLPQLGDSIDPFDFQQRIAAYKLLIDYINRDGVFGTQNERNIFWGYAVQLHWQWQTGRLQFADTPPGRIAANTPWGYANYSLSIIPLIAAMQVGLVPEKEILTTDSALEHASGGGKAGPFKIPTRFDAVVREWQELFRMVARMSGGDDIEPIRFKQWVAHFYSLVAVEPVIQTLEAPYSQRERDFLTGWIRMVDFLGTAAWRTDLEFMLQYGTGVLPERMLSDRDVPGQSTDLDETVNRNVANISHLAHQSKWRFAFNLWLWKRAMRTRAARAEVVTMLDATFNPSPRNVAERRRLLRYILAP